MARNGWFLVLLSGFLWLTDTAAMTRTELLYGGLIMLGVSLAFHAIVAAAVAKAAK